ncbi:MAG: hypothetical protein UU76_C0006G0015 [Parcubacteria group bacterium GW2011_GWC1_41_7]|nr:MAG: hypothetical protein UU76_C0006G0015 [Parcubacteria group bacterium GW2011_GWC1_41_7]
MQIPILDKIAEAVVRTKDITITLGIALAVPVLIYVGWKYIASKGQASKVHTAALYVIVGLLLIFLVYQIPVILREILGPWTNTSL